MTSEARQRQSEGAPKTIPQSRCGPVAMVRTQKVGIKYKKPIAFRLCTQGSFIDRDGVWLGRGMVKLWMLRGRTGRLGTHFFTQNS
jgi:hypothetical protein